MASLNAKLLLVEDHRHLAATICEYLEQTGFVVDYASEGATALYLAQENSYDAIILDVMLPGIDGFEICRQLRTKLSISTPVLFLTARDQLDDKLQGFSEGGDDYLVKPFEMPELNARVSALIRRVRGELDEQIVRIHDLTINIRARKVERAGKNIRLSPTAFRILRILMRESPNIVTREALEHELWGDVVPDSDTLRSHLYNLRKAIDKPFETALMHTIQGVGVKISAPENQP
ncbi:MAG: response regulator transcription factor [Gammaproteobacteria bacterium]|nr:response regulator transcription factor [Gammaproteobacteria bacterium]